MNQPNQNSGPTDADLRNFSTMIVRLEGGALNEELSEVVKKAVKEISDACADRGGTHKSTITLSLEFVMNQKDKVVEVTAAIGEKYPKAPRGRAGMFFADKDGNMTRNSPHQMTIEDELQKRRNEATMEAAGVVHSGV